MTPARTASGNVNVHIEGEGRVTAGEERTRTASIRDVARAADVSYQTVSRVLNGHPSIRPATKQRVLDAMAELRYRPNQAARARRPRGTRPPGPRSASSSARAASTGRPRAWPPSKTPHANAATG